MGPPHGSRQACTGNSLACGFCDGTNTAACAYPDGGACANVCSSGTETLTTCRQGDCVNLGSSSCNGFACESDAGPCKTTCAVAADCVNNFICDDGGCVLGTTCIDDHTAQPPNAPSHDCTPYKCQAGCKTSCTSVADCVPPNVCDPTGHCTPPATTSGGCNCDTTSQPSGPWMVGLLGLGGALMSRLRRSRREKRRT